MFIIHRTETERFVYRDVVFCHFLNYETFLIHMYNRECELRYFKILKSVNIFNDSVNKRGGTGICLILKIDDVWVAYYLFRGELS